MCCVVSVILGVELAWLIVGVIWVSQHYDICEAVVAKRAVLGMYRSYMSDLSSVTFHLLYPYIKT